MKFPRYRREYLVAVAFKGGAVIETWLRDATFNDHKIRWTRAGALGLLNVDVSEVVGASVIQTRRRWVLA